MQVEVVYGHRKKQTLIQLEVAEGTTAAEVIEQSGILLLFPEIDLQNATIGIFSQRCQLSHQVKAGDRVEIYRELLIDPMQARRERANEGKD